KGVQLPMSAFELLVDESQACNQRPNVRRRGLGRSARHDDRGLFQNGESLRRVDAPNAMVLENLLHRRYAHARRLGGRRQRLPEVEHPLVCDVLPSEKAPTEWAGSAGGVLYSPDPIREDGSFETGDVTKQATLTLDNLKRTVEAAGGTMDDVTQVLVHLTSPERFTGMNATYEKFFRKPYPNRATVVAGLMVKGA